MLSRTDSIGDVVLTLPMAGQIKRVFPNCRIIFLGRTYTRDVISVCRHVDTFVNYDELVNLSPKEKTTAISAWKAHVFIHVFPRPDIAWMAMRARVPHRAGTRSRWYHWITCNHLVRLPRKRSRLHEAQLNLKLLRFLNVHTWVPLEEIPDLYGFGNVPPADETVTALIDKTRVNLILHPRSKGSAVEWGLPNYRELIALLPAKTYKIFITGTAADGQSMERFLERHSEVTNLCGKLSLAQLIAFISRADALVAASTGPLHIAAALGIKAIGLYSARRPLFPQRWGPVGKNAHALVADASCEACRRGKKCDCVQHISPRRVLDLLES